MNDEATRQRRLLAAIGSGEPAGLRLREPADRARRGLAAYGANAAATADRALGAVFPVVRAMVGDDTFRAMARGHWRDDPPLQGDLGEWGDGFAGWIEVQESLADWPWLADSARLEWALHGCERAADAQPDGASIRALAQADPDTVRLRLVPGCALVASPFPIVTIHDAHGPGSAGFVAAREALRAGEAERAFVARRGWRAEARAVDPITGAWLAALLAGRSLADALALAGDGFDFAAWLAQALRAGWVKGSEPWPDPPG